MALNSLPPLSSVDRQRLEKQFVQEHKHDSKEDLIYYVQTAARDLGKIPTKDDILGSAYLRSRLGPWPRVLEQAGLKAASKNRSPKDHNSPEPHSFKPRYHKNKHKQYDPILASQKKARDQYYALKAAER